MVQAYFVEIEQNTFGLLFSGNLRWFWKKKPVWIARGPQCFICEKMIDHFLRIFIAFTEAIISHKIYTCTLVRGPLDLPLILVTSLY